VSRPGSAVRRLGLPFSLYSAGKMKKNDWRLSSTDRSRERFADTPLTWEEMPDPDLLDVPRPKTKAELDLAPRRISLAKQQEALQTLGFIDATQALHLTLVPVASPATAISQKKSDAVTTKSHRRDKVVFAKEDPPTIIIPHEYELARADSNVFDPLPPQPTIGPPVGGFDGERLLPVTLPTHTPPLEFDEESDEELMKQHRKFAQSRKLKKSAVWVEDLTSGGNARFVQVQMSAHRGIGPPVGPAVSARDRSDERHQLQKVFAAYSTKGRMSWDQLWDLTRDCDLLGGSRTLAPVQVDMIFVHMVEWEKTANHSAEAHALKSLQANARGRYDEAGPGDIMRLLALPPKIELTATFEQWYSGLSLWSQLLWPNLDPIAAWDRTVKNNVFPYAKAPGICPVYMHFGQSRALRALRRYERMICLIYEHYCGIEDFLVGSSVEGISDMAVAEWITLLTDFNCIPQRMTERTATVIFMDSRQARYLVGDVRLSFEGFVEALKRVALLLFSTPEVAATVGDRVRAFGPPCDVSVEVEALQKRAGAAASSDIRERKMREANNLTEATLTSQQFNKLFGNSQAALSIRSGVSVGSLFENKRGGFFQGDT